MLELRHVSKKYRGIPAVEDVSFLLREGEILGYLGPNGSGKSTTVKMVIGMIQPTRGKVLFAGRDIHEDLAVYRRTLGYVCMVRRLIASENCSIAEAVCSYVYGF
jgi:ABC-2 type transport system ATP-binding protein